MEKEKPRYPEIERKIVNLLASGDEEAISLAYDHYGHALYGIVRRIIASEELAQEILHNVFIKIWLKAETYDRSKGRLYTWMANIAKNSAIDATRSASFKKLQKTDALDPFVFNNNDNAHIDSIRDSGLIEVVNKLDDKYKNLIELVYYKGYTQSEIVEELGIPLGTVKTRIRTALQELRKLLEPEMMKYLILISTLFG